MDLKNNVAEYLCFGKTLFIYFSEMLKVNHAFQIQGDVINECREDGKVSLNIGIKKKVYMEKQALT